ncbi:MAG: ABC transporter permease, partial [Acidobacteriota bacterium]
GVARRLGVAPGARLSLQVATGSRGVATTVVAAHRTVHTGFSEIDDRWVLAALGDLTGRAAGVSAHGVEVWLADPERAADAAVDVENALGGRSLVTTWQDANRNLFAALRWQKLSLAVVLSLVLGVGAFEVASALVVLVTEKRRALGVLLAIGGRPTLLRWTLVLAGGTLGAVGVLGGVALGLGLAAALSALGVPTFPAEIAAIYGVDHIPLSVNPADVLAVVGLGLAEVTLAALLPAHRAARREPVEILRWI